MVLIYGLIILEPTISPGPEVWPITGEVSYGLLMTGLPMVFMEIRGIYFASILR